VSGRLVLSSEPASASDWPTVGMLDFWQERRGGGQVRARILPRAHGRDMAQTAGGAMSHATLDRVLAVLVVALAASGLLSLRAGSPGSGWIFVVHGVLGGALAAATVLKLRRSVPRAVAGGRWRRLLVAGLVSFATVAALTGGFLWVASGSLLSVGSWTVLTLHAWAGLVLVPLVVIHLLPRRWRLLRYSPSRAPRVGVSRRSVLVASGLAVAGLGAWVATASLDRVLGGVRRFTGSRWLPAGGIPPATTFFGEGTPAIDPDAWRVAVVDFDGRTRQLGLADLRSGPAVERDVVLDCTSGWAMDTRWRGVPLTSLVLVPPGRRVRVTSVTGWGTVLEPDAVPSALLATGVAGVDLPAANGAPCRLVVPDHRGLDWVKWVAEIRVI
jgi:DMSO/TMAO reductase YedYZ molybdopterin-dependent catalytic subunit